MSEIVDRGVIGLHAYPITVELRVLPHLPSCHFSRILPIWEAEIIYDLASAFGIESLPPDEMTFENAIELRGKIFSAVGERFSDYADLTPGDFDIIEREVLG